VLNLGGRYQLQFKSQTKWLVSDEIRSPMNSNNVYNKNKINEKTKTKQKFSEYFFKEIY